ncbi:BTAD domain-containing putative transcriptional regulator [Streptomyces sp. NPDC058335]|uniref:BTAD domain-containing putative transcriptional regulator n=1 Tax=Streptomyces sp. NPDC058335 TaxID=3346451 RepID=UPI003669AD19
MAGIRRSITRESRGGEGGGESVSLVTQQPGYCLRADAERVDAVRFQRMFSLGRTDLAAGDWQKAATGLQQALALWRGPVLADLVEAGVDWPEIAALRQSRLAALEDCMEALLMMGRHHEVVHELEDVVRAESPRERLCGQLMLALYRGGRQADALGVYRHLRTRLVEELGLDPSPELRQLERAILDHAPELNLPAGGPDRVGPPLGGRLNGRAFEAPAAPRPEPVATGGLPGEMRVERKRVSVLLVRAETAATMGEYDPEHMEEILKDLTSVVREEAEPLGGIVHGTIGSARLVVFGVPRTREDDAECAVRAALSLRDRFATRNSLPGRFADSAPTALRLAVATGEVLVVHPYDEDGRTVPEAAGAVVDTGLALLARSEPGDVVICDATRRASEQALIHCSQGDARNGWGVIAARTKPTDGHQTSPFIEREREMSALHWLFGGVLRRRRQHLVTVVGEAGIGKSRLLAEFGRRAARGPDNVCFLVGRATRVGQNNEFCAVAGIVKSYAGIADSDSSEVAERKLADALRRLVGEGHAYQGLLPHLAQLVSGPGVLPEPSDGHTALMAFRRFVEEIAARRPVVLVFEDMHWASDSLLHFVENLATRTVPAPMLVVTTARPEIFRRKPEWARNAEGISSLHVQRLSDRAVRRLMEELSLRNGLCDGEDPREGHRRSLTGAALERFRSALLLRIGGNPLFAVEFAGMLRDGGSAVDRRPATLESALHWVGPGGVGFALPKTVHTVVASEIDELPPPEKAVLQDAAVLREWVTARGIAALSEGGPAHASVVLESLEQRGLLRRGRGLRPGTAPHYGFSQVLVRDVAYSQLPRSTRSEKHRRAALWLEQQPGDHRTGLAFHRSLALRPDRHGLTPDADRGPSTGTWVWQDLCVLAGAESPNLSVAS